MSTIEQRTATIAVENVRTEGKTLAGFAALYNAESRDLGGFTETIMPGAFEEVLAGEPDVYLTFNHSPDKILARTTSGTLRLRDEERGLAFEAHLGDGPTAQDVRDMVRRGDVTGASFRFLVSRDGERWQDDRRTLTRIAELIDLSLATTPAYDGPRVELRTRPQEEGTIMEASTVEQTLEEDEGAEERASTGGLRVADLNQGRAEIRTLLDEFRHAGWRPGARTEIAWNQFENSAEQRALTFTSGVSTVDKLARDAGGFGADQRYAWPAFPRIGVDAGITSVDVLSQTARTLPTAANTVRALDAVTAKPEVASTITVTNLALKQVAAIESGIPNVYLENDTIKSIVGQDLRLAVNEGLDKLVLDALAVSGFQTPGTDNILVSVRNAMTTIYAAGYSPDTLILTPAASEAIDTMVSGVSGGTADFVFGAGSFGPGTLFAMNVRVSKTIAAPAVVDASAFGKLYASPVNLATFEENAGSTNSSLVRMELHAVFGTERQNAAIRIAAS
jgi:HK97 family phage prohead protease